MIEAVCDGCGKRITLTISYGGMGFNLPSIWKIEAQNPSIEKAINYRVYCIDCRIENNKKVDE